MGDKKRTPIPLGNVLSFYRRETVAHPKGIDHSPISYTLTASSG
jgi:hypothetical protein